MKTYKNLQCSQSNPQPVENFHVNRTMADGKQSWCKPCCIERAVASTRNRRAVNQLRANEIKLASGCVDCGYRENPVALDFDHLDAEEKVENVSRMLHLPWKRVLLEIAKCQVVCACCHRVRTEARKSY